MHSKFNGVKGILLKQPYTEIATRCGMFVSETNTDYRGELLLCSAAARYNTVQLKKKAGMYISDITGSMHVDDMEVGCTYALCKLVDVLNFTHVTRDMINRMMVKEVSCQDHVFVIEDIRRVVTVPFTGGTKGLWNMPEEVINSTRVIV
jgi:hypothetical protein